MGGSGAVSDVSGGEATENSGSMEAVDPAAPLLPLSPLPPVQPRSRTALYAALTAVGMLAVATATGTAVYELGSPRGKAASALSAAVPSPKATASPSATQSPAAVATPTPSATPTPTPSSTVKGYVNGSSHSGDIRFFLLPVPADAGAYGDADGTKIDCTAVSKTLSDSGTSLTILKQLGCKGGAYRTYQTDDNAFTVTVNLIHFGSDGDAREWVSGMSFTSGKTFTIPGVSDAQGVALNPTGGAYTGELEGLSHVGDIEYDITVEGVGAVPHSMLTQLMQREEKLLTTGH